MQYAKDEIRRRILDAAKTEFLDKGFEGASIRTIAAKAETAKSNVYNYFRDKDDLFSSVLEGTVTTIRKGLELARSNDAARSAVSYTREAQKGPVAAVTAFVAENAADVRLLLFRAQGSGLENFKMEVVDAFTDIMASWAHSVRPDREISRIFIRSVTRFYLSVLEEAVTAGIQKEQLGPWQDQVIDFVYNGWAGVFRSDGLHSVAGPSA